MNIFDSLNTKKKNVGKPPGSLEYTGQFNTETIIIEVIEYNDKVYKRYHISDLSELNIKMDRIYWINVIGLHNRELVEKIGNRFELHRMDLEDSTQVSQRSKIEFRPTYLFTVLKMIYKNDNEKVKHEHISIFVKSNILLTLQEVKGDVFDGIRDRLANKTDSLREKSINFLYYLMLDSVIDHFIVFAEVLERTLSNFETLILTQDEIEVDTLYSFKKELLFFNIVILSVKEALVDFTRKKSLYFDDLLQPYYDDLKDRLKQISDYLRSFKEITDSIYDMQIAKTSIDMNKTMMTLTIFATIFIPLTFLSGVFGMNFKYFPGMSYKYSIHIFITICVVVAILMLRYLKRK